MTLDVRFKQDIYTTTIRYYLRGWKEEQRMRNLLYKRKNNMERFIQVEMIVNN
uniref:Uncharacterized protein n=1 Tax=Anguilla anguilla TaxID=7936 RepID=A0A0E9P8K7_ANGAN